MAGAQSLGVGACLRLVLERVRSYLVALPARAAAIAASEVATRRGRPAAVLASGSVCGGAFELGCIVSRGALL